MFETIILALALSMDAFAVSIGLGSKHGRTIKKLPFISACYFGAFQGIMPLIGYWGGKEALLFIDPYVHWIAFLLLTLVGGKMVYESTVQGVEESISKITHYVMLMLAIATSIDAIAAGFSLVLLNINPIISCVIIGTITFIFSWIGVLVGKKSGVWLESKAELMGGIVLILIGLKLLLV